jgi:hypothetical protein
MPEIPSRSDRRGIPPRRALACAARHQTARLGRRKVHNPVLFRMHGDYSADSTVDALYLYSSEFHNSLPQSY